MTQYLNVIRETDVIRPVVRGWACEFQFPVSSLIDSHQVSDLCVFALSVTIDPPPFTHLRTIKCQQGLTAVSDCRELNTFSQRTQR